MSSVLKPYDVVGIGHALVDVLISVDDQFLVKEKMVRGTMALIDEARADHLYAQMDGATEVSGGCAASTVVGAVACGARGAYMGTRAEDSLGESFIKSLADADVEQFTIATEGVGTGRCLIMMTSDGERTMNTFLGAAALVGPDAERNEVIENASVVFVEAYLLDSRYTAETMCDLGRRVRASGGRLAITLSDPFCIDRHRDALHEIINNGVDICIGNEEEICALYGVDNAEVGLKMLAKATEIACVTCGDRGSMVATGDDVWHVEAERVKVVDTTGAGDVYASGFLYGISQGWELERCARMGSKTASVAISLVGARVSGPIAPVSPR